MIAWNVYLNDKLLDTVFSAVSTAEDVRRSLIAHDGYDAGIVVVRKNSKVPE